MEQLGAEARDLEQDARPEPAASPAGEGAGDGAASPGAAEPGAAPEAEVIRNPAPHIAAALQLARDVPFFKAMLPPAVVGVLSDEAIAELSAALGDVAVKYGWDWAPALGQWKVELRAAMALGSVALRVYQAMHAQDDASRSARARDVSDAVPADPPNPAAGVPPVEPGA